MFGALTLEDYGELRLIEEVVLPLAREYDVTTTVGDDCAIVSASGPMLAVTADVGPTPLVWSLPGYERDLEAAGWLSVVVSASDIATAGARPLCATNCIDAPPNLLIEDLVCFLRGYFRACSEFGFRNGGGDLRQGPRLSIRVFAVGVCDDSYCIGRSGANEGDHLIVIGPTGEFMATYLAAAEQVNGTGSATELLSPSAEETLRFPRPKLIEMMTLHNEELVVAASDTSDGLLGAIDNLARASQCGFEMALSKEFLPNAIRDSASDAMLDPWNIFFAWGDWSVAAIVRSEDYARFSAVCRDSSIQYLPIGRATSGSGRLTARIDNRDLVEVIPIRNENFVSRGFNAGLEGHLDYILGTSLFRPAKG